MDQCSYCEMKQKYNYIVSVMKTSLPIFSFNLMVMQGVKITMFTKEIRQFILHPYLHGTLSIEEQLFTMLTNITTITSITLSASLHGMTLPVSALPFSFKAIITQQSELTGNLHYPQ